MMISIVVTANAIRVFYLWTFRFFYSGLGLVEDEPKCCTLEWALAQCIKNRTNKYGHKRRKKKNGASLSPKPHSGYKHSSDLEKIPFKFILSRSQNWLISRKLESGNKRMPSQMMQTVLMQLLLPRLLLFFFSLSFCCCVCVFCPFLFICMSNCVSLCVHICCKVKWISRVYLLLHIIHIIVRFLLLRSFIVNRSEWWYFISNQIIWTKIETKNVKMRMKETEQWQWWWWWWCKNLQNLPQNARIYQPLICHLNE